MTRRRKTIGLAAIGAVVVVLLTRGGGHPDWSVTLHASAAPLRPWQSTELTADIGPNVAVGDGWKLRWESSGHVDGRGTSVQWRAGKPGVHAVTVHVTSPWGSERTATTSITVVDARPPDPTPPPGIVTIDPRELPFRIADVVIDKDSLCRDETTTIHVVAEDDRGDGGWLEPRIAGQRGWTVSYRRTGEPGLMRVPIELRDPTLDGEVTTDVYIELRDCVADWNLFLRPVRDRYREERYDFTAMLHPGPAQEEFEAHGGNPPPVTQAESYAWDFGDGVTTITTEPTLAHVFPAEADRPAGERSHVYLVRVEARDGSGQPLAATTTSVILDNRLRSFRHDGGQIMLATEQDAPIDGADGQRRVATTLRNLDTEAARLTELDVSLIPCDGGTPEHRTVAVATVFPTDRIAPGATIRGVLAWPQSDAGRICNVDVAARGTSEPNGLAVTGSFTLRLGAAAGDATAINDHDRVALLEKVRHLLGGNGRFSPLDIQRLEDKGELPPGTLAALTTPPGAHQPR